MYFILTLDKFILWVRKHGGKAPFTPVPPLPHNFFLSSFLAGFLMKEWNRPPNQFIAPVQEPYGYIIFRASEVKDLSVDEPPPTQVQHSVHDDPAVLGVTPITAPPIEHLQPQISQQPQAPPVPPAAPGVVAPAPQVGNQVAPTRRANPVHSAAASLETVERALGDLRVSNGGGPNVATTTMTTTHPNRGGGSRRDHGRGHINRAEKITVPATDFDFEGSNAKFEKAALRSPASPKDDSTPSGNNSKTPEGEKEPVGSAYNKSTSFFDSLSSSADAPAPSGGHNSNGRGRRGGAGGSNGRNRREEEREKNVATFGEPGGLGLLGPGGYVGGWGGYGRRGGRPRRGGGSGRGGHPVPAQG